MKKILACLMACLMIAGLFTGCGADKAAGGKVDEVVAANAAIAQQYGLQAENLLSQSDMFPAVHPN